MDIKGKLLVYGKKSITLEVLTDFLKVEISYQVSSELEGYSEGVIAEGIGLSANPDEQWKALKARLKSSKTEYSGKKNELYRKIQDTVTSYKGDALAEIVDKLTAVGKMIDAVGIKGDRLFTTSSSTRSINGS